MIVQIYEVTSPEEARALSAMGVDHVGVLVGDGSFPREQSIGTAREIFAAIRSRSKAAALLLSDDLDLIASLTAQLLPDILHLGAAPQRVVPSQLRALKRKFPAILLMRSIPVVDDDSISLAHSYDGIADFFFSIVTSLATAKSGPWAWPIAGTSTGVSSKACVRPSSSRGD